jgi:hypothetical protein
MENLTDRNLTIPKYLEELVKPTFGAFSKLVRVWDGLSVETQILILDYYSDNCPSYLINEICQLAINSQNQYIQYIGVKHGLGLNDKIKTFVASSTNPLLFCFANNIFNSGFDPKPFFGLEQYQRLSLISSHPETRLFYLVEIVKYYYKNNETKKHVSKNELLDIILEFKNNEQVALDLQTGFGESILSIPDIIDEEIWLVLVDLVLYRWTFGSEIVFQNIPEKVISKLFNRSDIRAIDVRKQIVFNNKYNFETRCSAASRHFSINFPSSEFSSILNLPKHEKVDLFFILSFATDCNLITIRATRDLIYAFGNQSGDGIRKRDAKERINEIIEGGLTKMEYSDRVKTLNAIRCYLIGVSQLPWNKTGPQEFKFGECKLLSKIFRSTVEKQYIDTYHLMFDLLRDVHFFFDDSLTFELENLQPTEFDFLVSTDIRHFISGRIEKMLCKHKDHLESRILSLENKIDGAFSVNSKTYTTLLGNEKYSENNSAEIAKMSKSIDEFATRLSSLKTFGGILFSIVLFLLILRNLM